jgi:hypothetical protein
MLKRSILMIVAICCCTLAGCIDWSEDSQGNIQSAGIAEVPLWQSSAPPAPLTPTDAGFSPEEAAKMSGPVLVLPPDQSSNATRYRFYQTGQNNCQQDLAKELAARASSNATGPAPYCTTAPIVPSTKGSALFF